MNFDHPLVLAALVPIAGAVGLLEMRLSAGMLRRTARWLVRTLLLGVLVAALAGAHRTHPVDLDRRLVVALDRATRLGAAGQAEADAIAKAAGALASAAGVSAAVTHFTTASVRAPASPPDAAQSVAAVGLAGARLDFGEHDTGGVLLVTDGRGDLDGLAAAAAALRAEGLAVTAAAVPREAPGMVELPRVRALEAPAAVRGPFDVRAALDAAGADRVEAILRVDGAEHGRLEIAAAGAGNVRFEELDLVPGLHEIAVGVRAAGTAGPEADLARTLVEVEAPPQVVALLGDPAGSPFRQALTAQGLRVAAVEPGAVASLLVGDAVGHMPDLVLADAAALAALQPEAAALLADRVRSGLGLLLEAGGSREAWEALAAGPLAGILPVRPLPEPPPPTPPAPPPPPEEEPEPPIEPPEPDEGPGLSAERQPGEALPITLLLVVDRSPSMLGPKIQMAIEGARRAAMALSPWDRVGVITFAHESRVDVPPRSARTAESLPLWLSTVQAGGEGTNIFGALQLAGQVLAKERSPILHMILLTDGMQWPGEAIFGPVVKPMRAKGITITAVGIGRGANMRELREIVQWAAGGMVIPVRDALEIPTVLTRDTQGIAERRNVEAERLARLRDPDQPPQPDEEEPDTPPPPPRPREPEDAPPEPPPAPIEEQATPPLPLRLVRRHEATTGFEDEPLPRVERPRLAQVTPGSLVLLEREDGRIALAARRAGLGRVLAWCLPPKDRGALAWSELGRLAGQAARAAMAPRGAFAYLPAVVVRQGPDGARVHVEWPEGESQGKLRLTWRGPSGQRELGVFSPGEGADGRPLPEAAPGTLCHLDQQLAGGPPLPPRSYLVGRLAPTAPQAGDAQGLSDALGAPLVEPAAFMAALPSGTRPVREPLWPWLLWIAVAMLPLDVWLHRRGGAA